MVSGRSASAATATWDGQGTTNLSSAANWIGDVAPVAGDSLYLTIGGGYLSGSGALYTGNVFFGTNNDFAAGTLFGNITIDGGWLSNRIQGNLFNLGGDITDNNPLYGQTFTSPIALTATRGVNVSSRFGTVTLSGVVSETAGGSGLTKAGIGLLNLTNTNTFTGPVTSNAGTLSINGDVALGAVPATATPGSIVLNGGALRSTASITLQANRGIALGASGGTLDANNAIVYNGIIAGAGNGLTKTGQNTLTLGGANSYTGTTTVNQGILKLDFSQAGAPAANIVNVGSALVLNGLTTGINASISSTTANPTLNVTSASAANSSQAFSGLTINGGQQTVSTTQTSAGNVLLNLGAITHNAGVVNFGLGGAFSSGINAITTTTANGASGILGGWASYNGSDYAANDGAGNLIAYTGYVITGSGALSSLATSNVQTQATGAIALSAPDAATTDINTLSSSSASTGAKTVTVGAAGTGSTGVLRLGADGGLLLGAGSGTITIGNVVGNGTLTAGGADNTAGVIHLINHSTAGNFSINSKIADNGTGVVSLRVGTYATPLSNTLLSLNGTNTFSGGIVVNGGRIAGVPGGFGTGAVTVRNGAQLYLSGTGTYTNDLNLAGNGTNTADTNSALRFQGNSVSGKITLQGDTNIALRNSTANQISGQITGPYNLTITGAGATGGNITLSNTTNNWNGNLTVDTETVKLGASEVLPNGAGFGSVVVTSNAASILDLNGFNETINGLVGTGTAGIVQNSAVSTASTLTVGDGDISSLFEGLIRDNGGTGGTLALVKIGSGVFETASTATFTGGVTVKAGILYGGSPTATTTPFGAVTNTITLGDTSGSASATLRQSNVGKNLAHPIVVAAGSSGGKVIDTLGGGQTFTYSGPVTLNDSLSLKTYTGNTNQLTLSGLITGTGAVNLIGGASTGAGAVNVSGVVAGANTGIIMNGTGTMVLSGQSTYTGNVVVNSGTLQASVAAAPNGATGAFGNTSVGVRSVAVNAGGTLFFSGNNVFGNNTAVDASLPAIVVNGGILRTTRYTTVGELDLSNGATVTNTATDTNNYQALALRGSVNVTGTTASTITATATSATQYGYHLGANTLFTVADVTGSSSTDLTVSAALRNQSGDFTNAAGGLTKAGAGTMQLTGASTYTGATVVNAGTLLVDGSLANGSAVTVGASGTLGGTGAVNGTVSAAGTLAPGDTATGTLTTGSATLGGTLAVQVDGANADKLQVNGNLDLTGSTLNVSVLGGGFTGSYVIAEYTGTLTGAFASLPSGYAVAYNTGVGSKQIVLTQVPGYDYWASSNGLTAGNNGPDQDPDHDGLTNLMEYVLGGDPLSNVTSVTPVQLLDATNLSLYFERSDLSKSDTTLKVQWSTDLVNWNDIVIAPTVYSDGTVNITDYSPNDLVIVSIPRSNAVNGKLFARVKATR